MYNIFLTGVFHLQFSTTNPLVIWKNRIELPPWSRNQRIEKRTWEGKITIQRVQQQEKEVSIDCTAKTHWNWETKQKKGVKKKRPVTSHSWLYCYKDDASLSTWGSGTAQEQLKRSIKSGKGKVEQMGLHDSSYKCEFKATRMFWTEHKWR